MSEHSIEDKTIADSSEDAVSSQGSSGSPDLWIAQRDSGSQATSHLRRLAHSLAIRRGVDLRDDPYGGEAGMEWVQELLNAAGPSSGENGKDQGGAVVGYEQKDAETFTCRIQIATESNQDLNSIQGGDAAIELRLLYSPTEARASGSSAGPVAAGMPSSADLASSLAWKLLDTLVITDTTFESNIVSSDPHSWSQTPTQARNHYLSRMSFAGAQAGSVSGSGPRNMMVYGEGDERESAFAAQSSGALEQKDDEYGDGEGGDGGGGAGNDFWGGYGTDEDDVKKEPTGGDKGVAPPALAAPLPRSNVETAESTPQAIHQAKFPSLSTNHALDPDVVRKYDPAGVGAPASSTTAGGPSSRHFFSPTATPALSRFATPDDSYWASYAGVEDGLKASNPPSPRRSAASTPGVFGIRGGPNLGSSQGASAPDGYWGTGGETPVSWSPPTRAGGQVLPSLSRRVSQTSVGEEDTGADSVDATSGDGRHLRSNGLGIQENERDSRARKSDGATQSREEPDVDADADGQRLARRKALETILSGVKNLFLSQLAAASGETGRAELEAEFREALRGML